MKDAAKDHYLKLVDEIKKHDELYFEKHSPLISDFEYDILVKKVEEIEKNHPDWVTAVSPTQEVGERPTKGFKQVKHSVPMFSLANSYNEADVKDFIKRVCKLLNKSEVVFAAELKMDGIAVSLTYKNGVFFRAITRGNGKVGDDITENIKTIKDVPMKLNIDAPPEILEVRGEVFMKKNVFIRLNKLKEEAGEDVWANPRNAAAGSLKLLDSNETKKRELSIIVYGVAENISQIVHTQEQARNFLKQSGFPVFSDKYFTICHKVSELLDFCHKIEKERDDLPFEIDGIVFKVNQLSFWDRLGVAGKKPRYAIAYKFAPQQATTVIEDITVQVGRTGVLTPVAELKPVFLAGSTIARATLHNEHEIERKDIRIGDTVIIEKGGDVIPKVVQVDFSKRIGGSKKWVMPDHCPICGSETQRKTGEVAVRCVNPQCSAQNLRRLIFFASKDAMDIDTLGDKVMTKCVERGLVARFSDIYKLSKEDLAHLEGFKEKSIHNLLSSIQSSKDVTLARFIFALGIPFIGIQTAEIIAEYIKKVEGLFSLTKDELIGLEGIGEKVADSYMEYFDNQDNIREIKELLKLGLHPKPYRVDKNISHSFLNKSFVLTGSLKNYSRNQASELIKQRGGKVSATVSKNTDFVLLGGDPGSKYEKAKKLGVKILSEDEFAKLL